jgi:hypothetical protein
MSINENSAILPEPFPGSPIIKSLDKESNIASIRLALTGAQTQKAFTEACEIFNAEVKKKDMK